MTGWAQGYVADIAYGPGFYRETTPNHLAFAALCAARHPGRALAPRRVLELGFGTGFGLVLVAAGMPHVHFEGADFNPQHAAHAAALAEAAGLGNVGIREIGFEELDAETREGQHDVDIVVAHGVLTWVSARARQAIVSIARKRLRPGGVLYVSYNSMPGCAPLLPLWHLMRQTADRSRKRSDQSVAEGLTLLRDLIAEGGGYLSAIPGLAGHVDAASREPPGHIAHEWLNANWDIFNFSEVAGLLDGAKLSYSCTATLIENVAELCIPPGARRRIAEMDDPLLRETLRDLAMNQRFRRDIFARGAALASGIDTDDLLDGMRFTLAVPRAELAVRLKTPLGEISVDSEEMTAVANCLDRDVRTFRQIADLPVFERSDRREVLHALIALAGAGQIYPIAPGPTVDPAPARRLNRVLIERATRGHDIPFLCAPLAGSAAAISKIEALILHALPSMQPPDPDATVARVSGSLERLGLRMQRNGGWIGDAAEHRAVLRAEVDRVIDRKVPFLRFVGAI